MLSATGKISSMAIYHGQDETYDGYMDICTPRFQLMVGNRISFVFQTRVRATQSTIHPLRVGYASLYPADSSLCSSMECSVCCWTWTTSLDTSSEIAPSGMGPIIRPSLSSRKIWQAIILDTAIFGVTNISERKDGLKTKSVVKMLNTTVRLQVIFHFSKCRCDAREPIRD